MSIQDMTVNELKDLAAFYVVDIEAKNADKPTKKEIVASLEAAEINDENVADFLKAKAEEKPKQEEAPKEAAPVEEVDTSNYVLLKYERKNPTYETLGYTFTKKHPFASVPPDVAEYLVRQSEGFRLALPSEVTDYYA